MITGHVLDAANSSHIFHRDGVVRHVVVSIANG
jgi:hypothetical protein